MKKIAFITGASRGIGRATAIAFARAGFDLAISARTLETGEVFQHSVRKADGRPLDGSLNATADAARKLGAQVLVVRMDLLDNNSVINAAQQVLDHYGRVDVLINNAIYQGADLNHTFMELQPETLERVAQGYIVAPFILTRKLMPAMLEQGAGVVINITSGAGEKDPPFAANKGGWGYGYGAGKAAVSRLSGVLSRELGEQGIQAFTVNPGVITTETLKETIGEKGVLALSNCSAAPEIPAAVFVWLATNTTATNYQMCTINAQPFAIEKNIKAES